MIFTQVEFYIFLAVVFAFLLTVRNFTLQKRFLLLASYYFYGYWDWRFLTLILSSTVVNYVCGAAISRADKAGRQKLYLIIALIFSLGMLGFFKYYNFFVESLNAILSPFGLSSPTLNIILPVGISFFTFQTLSYTIDVYRSHIKPCKDFFDFALFVAFFPQLVAGPIVRASEFLPQLKTPRKLSWHRAFQGGEQFVFGLFKKVFIADRLADFVDQAFGNASVFSGGTLWLAALAYSIQIYCDFSGYSDMAIGVARAMGYDFRRNFNLPYIASNIEGFWHRWHISLSTWLRDYLYIPLGGNRKGTRRTYINLGLTMVLGGLWHGAAWTFVFWGAWHGFFLAMHKWFRSKTHGLDSIRSSGAWKFFSWATTMLVVLVGWVFFRADLP